MKKATKLSISPEKRVVQLQRMHEIPARTFLLILSEMTPAKIPKTAYERENAGPERTP